MRVSWPLAAACCALVFGASQASAQAGPAFCANLKQVVGQLPAGLPDLTGDRIGPERTGRLNESYMAKLVLDGAVSCTVEQTPMASGAPQRAYFCQWRGGFAAARALFGLTETCLGGDTSKDAPLPPGGPTGPALLGSVERPGVVIIFQGAETTTSMMIVSPAHPMAMIRPGRR